MLVEERKKIILEKLKINSMVTLTELIDEIGASESTIRRDLQMLDKEGKLKKVHGGAIAIGDDYFRNDYKVIFRQKINKSEKQEEKNVHQKSRRKRYSKNFRAIKTGITNSCRYKA